mmetsp:Transcript_14214/g.33636  ORF Transcript_14214/g.33636 Transcript_14214/m.33636 type:complete len:336 (-) Transcript_14214:176-1183(-)
MLHIHSFHSACRFRVSAPYFIHVQKYLKLADTFSYGTVGYKLGRVETRNFLEAVDLQRLLRSTSPFVEEAISGRPSSSDTRKGFVPWRSSTTSASQQLSDSRVVQTSFASASVFERSWKRVESFFDKVAPGCPIISCSELEFRSRSCVGDQQGIRPPREIVWLNGAPGSGKGANTDFILEIRGLKRAVTVSQLLDDHPESKWLKEEGKLVPDEVVVEALLKAVLNPDSNDGVGILVDGFPRTALQVDAVQELYKKLLCLHDEHRGTPSEDMFPRPSFKVVTLYVDEQTSIERQVFRAKKALAQKRRMSDAGELRAVRSARATDLDIASAVQRYEV